MSDVVIQVENLSKYDRLGLIDGGTLREDVNRWIAKLQGNWYEAHGIGKVKMKVKRWL